MGILNQLRSTVSADKHRFVYGDIDIDFTYITDRIIGMALLLCLPNHFSHVLPSRWSGGKFQSKWI